MAYMENNYECTGICFFNKYRLFTDINKSTYENSKNCKNVIIS
jgi:hypothetical protein